MNERQAAVAELDLCQQALDTISGRTWQSTGIILAGEIAAVALMTQLEASALETAVLTTAFGTAALLLLGVWLLFVRRQGLIQKALIYRMRDLERLAGFERQAVMRNVTLVSVRGENGPKATVGRVLKVDESGVLLRAALIVAAGWFAVIVWRWLGWLID